MENQKETNQPETRDTVASPVDVFVRCAGCGEVIGKDDYGVEYCEDCMFNFENQDLEDQLEKLLED